MYINIGQNTIIPSHSVIAVFDLDNSSSSHITRSFLASMEKKGCVINIAEDLPKSFVLCRQNGKSILYLSQLSYQTLLKRSQTPVYPMLRSEESTK
ncbi:MAG: DUF370 domain-containing protein [Oscillospiraceae bacterium]|nr:DUF370 domain-containing protein [Oscillospiraceae bacterium]